MKKTIYSYKSIEARATLAGIKPSLMCETHDYLYAGATNECERNGHKHAFVR